MKKTIAIQVDIPEGLTDEQEIKFITELLKDMRIQPRAFTFGDLPSGNPTYQIDKIVVPEWEYV